MTHKLLTLINQRKTFEVDGRLYVWDGVHYLCGTNKYTVYQLKTFLWPQREGDIRVIEDNMVERTGWKLW